MAQAASAPIPRTRARIVGMLTRKLPLYRERGVTRATIFVNGYTIHLCGHDAAATQSLAIGSRVEITGLVRRSGRRNLVNEIDGEFVV
jgi:primosomal replication protein N